MSNGSERKVTEKHPAMKTCQFCFELVRLEAVKCKFCGSSLSEPASTEARDDKKVVYIVDRDLIRFAKFSVAILTLITIIGALFYGIDIKQLRTEIEKDNKAISEENRALSKELTTTLDGARKISVEVQDLRSKIEEDNKAIAVLRTENKAFSDKLKATLDEANQVHIEIKHQAEAARTNARRAEIALSNIQETQERATTKYEEIVALQDGSLTFVQQTTSVTSTVDVLSGQGKLWPNGTTLHVRYLGGEKADHAKVEQWAAVWSEVANIRFVFDDDPNAEIRISFEKSGGSWSYVGRDNVILISSPDQATMNLGWLDEPNVLHQFGHVLGLMHEHQNPYEPVPWNEEAVYAFFGEGPNFWDKATIDHNIIQSYSKDAFPIPKPFDSKSIMLYKFSNDLTTGDFPLESGEKLSEGDKVFIAKLYPKDPA